MAPRSSTPVGRGQHPGIPPPHTEAQMTTTPQEPDANPDVPDVPNDPDVDPTSAPEPDGDPDAQPDQTEHPE